MASVLFSSSRRDTEKLRGVQLYSRTSSLNMLRSAPPERHREDMIRVTSCQNNNIFTEQKYIWVYIQCYILDHWTHKFKASYLWLSYYGWRISPVHAMRVCTTPLYPTAIALAPSTSWPPPQCPALPQRLTTHQFHAGLEEAPQELQVLIHSAGKPKDETVRDATEKALM